VSEPNPRIAIFGTGGMGRELADILRADGHDKLVFVTDSPAGPVDGLEVVGAEALRSDDWLVIALGSSRDRRLVAERFAGRNFATVIAKSARLSPSALLGEGAAVCELALINNNVRIGAHFQANCFAQVSHDCIIGDFVTFAPRATCNGWVEIGDGVFVGSGAIIRNGSPEKRLVIGNGATIGMGAVVVGDVPAGAVVMGNPAMERR
jgi:sugar O-acyltransferase (sialic acid O-acetyltransferase NeuD family)